MVKKLLNVLYRRLFGWNHEGKHVSWKEMKLIEKAYWEHFRRSKGL